MGRLEHRDRDRLEAVALRSTAAHRRVDDEHRVGVGHLDARHLFEVERGAQIGFVDGETARDLVDLGRCGREKRNPAARALRLELHERARLLIGSKVLDHCASLHQMRPST